MDVDTTSYDKSQVDQLEDRCIIVDKEDRIIGSTSKKDCHIAANRSEGDLKSAGGQLHRAFSVFLFNSKNELLLQKRSKLKITYPGCYTNTCCSHPRATNIEMNDHEHIGVKIAAQRRMQFELGIPATQVPIEDIHSLTRIHYSATAGDIWAENEVDHVLLIKKDVDICVNEDEVEDVKFLSTEGLDEFLKTIGPAGHSITPWFKFICETFLPGWWNEIKAGTSFKELKDDKIWYAGTIKWH
eukprot:gene14799-5904_t